MSSTELNTCICSVIKDIVKKQQDFMTCPIFCCSNSYNTIPLIFICNNGNIFIKSGLFNNNKDLICFTTPFFRIYKYDEKKCCGVIELLQMQSTSGEVHPISMQEVLCSYVPPEGSKFIRTGLYIAIDFKCFMGVEALKPVVVDYGIPKPNPPIPLLIKVEISEYITYSDGVKRIYYDSDGIEGFNIIPDPATISYSNLFVNGVLQPNSFYQMELGKLTFKTVDLPIKNTVIILQLVKIINDYKTF